MHQLRTYAVLPVVVFLLAFASACGGDGNAGDSTAPATVEGGQVLVEMKDIKFSPEEITVKAGETVRWVNNDPVGHTVTDDGGTFDSGIIDGNGGSFEQTFEEPGTYPYHCSIHPIMKGTVIVEK